MSDLIVLLEKRGLVSKIDSGAASERKTAVLLNYSGPFELSDSRFFVHYFDIFASTPWDADESHHSFEDIARRVCHMLTSFDIWSGRII